MKLRLRITTPDGATRTFERAGPTIAIGRDSAGELSLQGDEAKSVSWNHARIDLTPAGATLADVGSSNGTLHNDAKIEGPKPLRVGDRVQLGFTGPTLLIVAIDLTAVAAPPTIPIQAVSDGSPQSQRVHVLAGGAAVAVLLLAATIYFATRGSAPKELVHVEAPPGTDRTAVTVTPEPKPTPPTPTPPVPQPKTTVPMPPSRPVKDSLADDIRPTGTFVALSQWGPAILLERRGEAFPWLPIRPEGKVTTGVTLVSLPGCRSTITLDSGVRLTLWGNLPEFSAFPPLLESSVMLNSPAAGVDLDVTLERGRIQLANAKPTGPARVQLGFLRQSWQLTLTDSSSEACAELWTLPASSAGGQSAVTCLGLFTKGKVQLQANGVMLDLPDKSRVTWLSTSDAVPRPETLPALPDWWSKPPDRSQPLVADALLTLADWASHLSRSNEVVDTLLTRVRESNDATLRVVGLVFLAALDNAPFLIDFLEDRQHAEVRGTARHAIQAWLARRPENPAELQRLLQEKRGYAREKSALVVRLMQPLPAADLARAETYQELIGYLDHENLLVRDLAFWHLANLVPEGPKSIVYDPSADGTQRKAAVDQWRKLVPTGSVPRRSA